MEALVGGAALFYSYLGEVWSYNQSNFFWDQQQRQNAIHQQMNMLIQENQIYREDLRDLFGLTISKVGTYMMVNTLVLGFAVTLFVNGFVTASAPSWLFAAHANCLATTLAFVMLSLWFSVHAGVQCGICAVDTLTKQVRLPIPSDQEVLDAHANADEFEHDHKNAFRLPFVQNIPEREVELDEYSRQMMERLNLSDAQQRLRDDHFHLYKRVVCQWSHFVCYARVSLSLGCYFLMQSLCYFALAWFAVDFQDHFGAFICILILLSLVFGQIWIEIDLGCLERILLFFLVFSGPLLAIGLALKSDVISLKPYSSFIFLFHAAQLAFLLLQVNPFKMFELPVKFRTVKETDAASWFTSSRSSDDGGSENIDFGVGRDLLQNSEPEGMDIGVLKGRLSRWFALFEQQTVQNEHLRPEQCEQLRLLRASFDACCASRKTSPQALERLELDQQAEVAGGDWVCLFYWSEKQPVPYWVNANTGEERWDPPEELGCVAPSLLTIVDAVHALVEKTGGRSEVVAHLNKNGLVRSASAMMRFGYGALELDRSKSSHLDNGPKRRLSSTLPFMPSMCEIEVAHQESGDSLALELFWVMSLVLVLVWLGSSVFMCFFSNGMDEEVWRKGHFQKYHNTTDVVARRLASKASVGYFVESFPVLATMSSRSLSAGLEALVTLAAERPLEQAAEWLAQHCSVAEGRGFGNATAFSELLREEVDLGDGYISATELRLWLQASPGFSCDVHAAS